jgi:predicted ATPase
VASADGTPPAADLDASAEPDPLAVLDALTQLVERSLVVVEPGRSTRYRLLETIRQYARDRLVESGETDAVRARHLAHFLGLAEDAERHMRSPEMPDWVHRLDVDADNLRLAIEWGLGSDPERGIRLCVALWLYWRTRSFGADLERWFDQALEAARNLPPPAPRDRLARDILVARLCSEAAFGMATWTNRDARALADEGLARARATGDLGAISAALTSAWTARLFAGKPEELVALGEEAVAVAGRAGDPWTQAMAAASLAGAFGQGGTTLSDRDRAFATLDDATRYARISGVGFVMAFVALVRGRMAGASGRLEEARAAFQEAAAFYDEIGDSRFALVGLSDLGHAVRRGGGLDEALAILRRTIPEWEHSGNRGAIANQLESFGLIAVERAETDRAVYLLAAAAVLREESGAAMLSLERVEYDAGLERLHASMDPVTFEAAWAAGRTMSQADAVAFALEG